MSQDQNTTPISPVTVTPKAAEQLKSLMKAKGRDETKSVLRVFVQGGGCSGFQYGMSLEDEAGETDNIFESNEVRVAIDPISLRYLKGSEIDFDDTNLTAGFSIKNPNAKSTCGCGSSFDAK